MVIIETHPILLGTCRNVSHNTAVGSASEDATGMLSLAAPAVEMERYSHESSYRPCDMYHF